MLTVLSDEKLGDGIVARTILRALADALVQHWLALALFFGAIVVLASITAWSRSLEARRRAAVRQGMHRQRRGDHAR